MRPPRRGLSKDDRDAPGHSPGGGYFAKVLVMEDTDLRQQLVHLRENVIYGKNPCPINYRKHCVPAAGDN